MDDETPSSSTIPKYMYKWEFPVEAPRRMLIENVWYVSVCTDRNCREVEKDPGIPVTFVVPGFNLAEPPPKPLYPSTALRVFVTPLCLWAVLSIGLW